MDLTKKHCVPCEGGVAPLGREAAEGYLRKVNEGWELGDNGKKIEREFKFDSFKQAIDFVNKIAEIAESEGHHPDMAIHFRLVAIELWTHAIGGLSENDFILAAKIDEVV